MIEFNTLRKSTWSLAAFAASSFLLMMCAYFGPHTLPTATIEAQKGSFAKFSVVKPTYVVPLNEADSAWAHPLFFSDRKQHTVRIDTANGTANQAMGLPLDGVLTGIVISKSVGLASLQLVGKTHSTHVRLGEEVPDVGGWKLVGLTSKTAKFSLGTETRLFELDTKKVSGPNLATALYPISQSTNIPSSINSTADRASVTPRVGQPPSTPTANELIPADNVRVEQPTPDQGGQIETVRQRIEAARRSMKTPVPPAKP